MKKLLPKVLFLSMRNFIQSGLKLEMRMLMVDLIALVLPLNQWQMHLIIF